MVVWKGGKVEAVSIDEVVKKGTTLLDTNSDFIKAAQALGMYIGEAK